MPGSKLNTTQREARLELVEENKNKPFDRKDSITQPIELIYAIPSSGIQKHRWPALFEFQRIPFLQLLRDIRPPAIITDHENSVLGALGIRSPDCAAIDIPGPIIVLSKYICHTNKRSKQGS